MASDAEQIPSDAITTQRCPTCDTLMTAEQAGPIRFANPARRIVFPSALTIGAGQSVTRMLCENGHAFWHIEDDDNVSSDR